MTRKGETSPIYSPLFIPSVSSTLHPDLRSVLRNLSGLPSAEGSIILISAFDVAAGGHLPKNLMASFRGVVLDSGGYEARRLQKAWKKPQFERIASRISTDIIVGFDEDYHAIKRPWRAQIEQQIDFLKKQSGRCARTLLLHVDLLAEDLEAITGLLANLGDHFEILGIVEKDLGIYFQDRVGGIAKLRVAMDSASLIRPIHIFGVDDPLSLILYSFAGADLFDGLGWFTECIDPSRLARHDLGHVTLLPGWEAFERGLKNRLHARQTLSAALEWNLRTFAGLMGNIRRAILRDEEEHVLKMLSGSALKTKDLLRRILNGR